MTRKKKLPRDTPSETVKTGLPTVGEGAAAKDYVEDIAPKSGAKTPEQARKDEEE